MPNITFTEVELKSFKRTRKEASAAFTAALTKTVTNAMEWPEEVPDCFTGATPEGLLVASSVELTPSQKDLEKLAVNLGVSNVNGFSIVRRELESKRGKGHRSELHFVVTFTDANGCARLERYLAAIGAGKSRLAVSYQKQAEQEQLISEEQAEDTTRDD